MAFTTSCFIRKNTPELRKKLEELGYINGAWETPRFHYPYLSTWPNPKFGLFKGDGFYMTEDDYRFDGKVWEYKPKEGVIDCGTNEELFLALAALRDDTDKNQWFIFPKTQTKRISGCFGQVVGMDGHYQEIIEHEWIQYNMDDRNLSEKIKSKLSMCCCDEEKKFIPHKATVEEIIEHFK